MSFGDRKGLLVASGGFSDHFLDDFIGNMVCRWRFLKRNGHAIDSGNVFGPNLDSQIDFIEQNEQLIGFVRLQEGIFSRGERL